MTKERSAVIGLSPVQGSDEIDNGLFVLARLGTGDDDLVLSRGTLNAGLFVPLHRHDDIECIHVAGGNGLRSMQAAASSWRAGSRTRSATLRTSQSMPSP